MHITRYSISAYCQAFNYCILPGIWLLHIARYSINEYCQAPGAYCQIFPAAQASHPGCPVSVQLQPWGHRPGAARETVERNTSLRNIKTPNINIMSTWTGPSGKPQSEPASSRKILSSHPRNQSFTLCNIALSCRSLDSSDFASVLLWAMATTNSLNSAFSPQYGDVCDNKILASGPSGVSAER